MAQDYKFDRDEYLDSFYTWLCDNVESDIDDMVPETETDLHIIKELCKIHGIDTDFIDLHLMKFKMGL